MKACFILLVTLLASCSETEKDHNQPQHHAPNNAAGAMGADTNGGSAGTNDGTGSSGSGIVAKKPESYCGISGVEYRHTLAKSRAPIAASAPMDIEGDMHKWVGEQGVFVVSETQGWASLVLNAGAPQFSVPQTTSGFALADLVREYFVSAGILACEVASVTTSVQTNSSDTEVRYYNGLVRSVAGFPVASSIAYASLHDNGHTSVEEVFWPAIPAETVDAARSLQVAVDDGSLFSKLPTNAPHNGVVQIHHTSMGFGTPTQSWAAYDVVVGPVSFMYDIVGKEIPSTGPS